MSNDELISKAYEAMKNSYAPYSKFNVGISNYDKEQTIEIAKIFKKLGTPFIINQRKYSIFERKIEEDGLKDYAKDNGIEIWAI